MHRRISGLMERKNNAGFPICRKVPLFKRETKNVAEQRRENGRAAFYNEAWDVIMA